MADDKNVNSSSFNHPNQMKAPGEMQSPLVPVDFGDNPKLAVLGNRGMRDRTSAPVGNSVMADKPAAPSFMDDFFHQMGLSTKPVMVLALVGVTFMFFWKAA